MLSDISIRSFLESEDIVIDPLREDAINSCRMTIRLGQTILIPDSETVVDVPRGTIPEYESISITTDEPYVLQPGEFVLAETYEKIGLSEKVSALIEARSTIARFGISVVQSAMLLDSGQQPKHMTLEIYNASKNPFKLYAQMDFCRLMFFVLNPPASMRYDTTGRYIVGDDHKPKMNN